MSLWLEILQLTAAGDPAGAERMLTFEFAQPMSLAGDCGQFVFENLIEKPVG